MRFFLLLLVTAVLLLRPAEIVPELEDAPIYEVVILACLICSITAVLTQLTSDSLAARPITLCILGLQFTAVMSHLAHLSFTQALDSGMLVFKVLVLYLLIVAGLNSYARLRRFMAVLGGLLAMLAAMALLQYHGYIDIAALETFQQKEYDASGDFQSVLPRLCGPGIFHDPNDLCIVLAVGVVICFYWLGERRLGRARFCWLVPLGTMGYAIARTYSRGGLIALLVGLFVLLLTRFRGWKRLSLGLLALPVLVVLFGGRQTQFALGDREDTSQTRIRLWGEALTLLKESPLFGIGEGTYVETTGQVAHNSFVQAYTELGIVGGAFFLAAFVYALWGLGRLSGRRGQALNPSMRRMSHYLQAMVAALVAGICSLSRVFTPSTYIVLALVTAYLRLAARSSPALAPRLTPSMVVRMLAISILSLLAIHTFVLIFARWSSTM